jgi:hypothetical protein
MVGRKPRRIGWFRPTIMGLASTYTVPSALSWPVEAATAVEFGLHRDHFADSVFLHIAGKAGRHDFASVHNNIGISELVREIVVLFDQ